MGDVLPFRTPARRAAARGALGGHEAMPDELAVIAAVERGGGPAEVLAAAAPLLERLSIVVVPRLSAGDRPPG